MLDFFADNFSSCVFLAVILVSLIPTIESKIAIPFGMSEAIWGDATLSPIVTFICAFVGSMIPCLIVMWCVRKLKNKASGFVHDKFLVRLEEKYKKRIEKLSSKNKTFYKLSLLAMFVAVPLPLTGVYAGSLIAGLTNLKMWQAFLAIMVGAFFSCLVVTLLCVLFENSTLYILIASLIIIALFLLFDFFAMIFKKRKSKKEIELFS